MRYTGSKAKRCRATGVNLYGNQKFDKLKNPYRPGQHGQARVKKSDYANHLLEKQKIKWTYGCTERQLLRIYEESAKKKEATGVLLLQTLEMRLDNVAYKSGWFASRDQVRQLVSHGHIKVNGKRVKASSFKVKIGDEITFEARSLPFIKAITAEIKMIPAEWVDANKDALKIRCVSIPTRDQIDQNFNEQFLVEFYSR